MIFCPICGTANREGSRFCNQCGARLVPEEGIKCQVCGALNPPGSERCANCGASLKIAPTAEKQPPEELPYVPVFPEEVISEIPEEELPDFLSDLRAKIREMEQLEEEEKPPETFELPEWEMPSLLEEEKPEAEKPPVIEEYPKEREKPTVTFETFEWEGFSRLAEEEKYTLEVEEAKPPAIEEFPEEELPDWLREAERFVPPTEPPAPAEWLKEVEIPWLEEETVEVPVLAELPPWLEALRPVEEIPEAPPVPEEVEEEGLLKGLKGLLKPASIFMPPEKLVLREKITQVSPGKEEIQKLVKLLPVAPGIKIKAPAKRTRTHRLLYFILFLAVLIPLLLGWPPMPSGSPPTPPGVETLYQTVEALPNGSPVLVAFDYEPYLAGEMDLAASPVLTHLREKGCRLALVSLRPTGPALAQELVEKLGYNYGEEFVNLGYIPAFEASLRAFGTSLTELVKYDYLWGEPLDSLPAFQGITNFTDWKLALLLSSQTSTLVGWIEQVGSIPQVSMAAVVIAGLKPYAEPYLSSGQLKGLMGGASDAAFYEILRGKPSESAKIAPIQAFVILIALLMILVGSIARGRGEGHAQP